MFRYIIGRIIESAVVLMVLSFVVYGLIGLMPGDPIDLMIQSDPKLTPADATRLKALYGLDQPIMDRYFAWLSDVFRTCDQMDIKYCSIHEQSADSQTL